MARAHKRITRTQLTGQKGINLIEKRVLDMGFLWHPAGNIEAGIDGTDGTIEIRDDATGDVLNIDLAVPKDAGIYLAPPPRRELLYSNLLPVASYAERLYIAETDWRQRADVWREMRRLDVHPGGEYVLSGKRILSVHDLREYPWDHVCDVGTVDEFDMDEWAESDAIPSGGVSSCASSIVACARSAGHTSCGTAASATASRPSSGGTSTRSTARASGAATPASSATRHTRPCAARSTI
jgi:hypothetical protein